jgi:hypothetical protein
MRLFLLVRIVLDDSLVKRQIGGNTVLLESVIRLLSGSTYSLHHDKHADLSLRI